MDNMEKVDRLRERANVTYEEAKAALENHNWDILDAMVELEKQGKTVAPNRSNYSTSYEQQADYVKVQEKVDERRSERTHVGRSIGAAMRRFFRICVDDVFCITRKGSEIFRVPVLVLVLALFFMWEALIPIMIIAMFFGCRYSFQGKDKLREANDFMDKAGSVVENLQEGYFSKDKED